jgi:hypothetical protein
MGLELDSLLSGWKETVALTEAEACEMRRAVYRNAHAEEALSVGWWRHVLGISDFIVRVPHSGSIGKIGGF